MSQTVLVPRIVADTPLDATIESLLRGRVEVVPLDSIRSEGSAPVEAEGLYTYGHPTIDGALLDRINGLKVISNYGVGVDHIRLDDAQARRIPVGNTPGVLESTAADLGLALLLASARRIVEGDRYARSSEFVRYDPGHMLGREVHGKTLGILGMGQIGARVARRAVAFEMTVLYHNRHRRKDVEAALAPSIDHAGLDDLLARSDYVMLCTPLTDQTRGLIGERTLALMKPSATLINIARGAVVDTEALSRALLDGRIAAAALDVTDPEPLPRDHPLLALPQVVITPHLGSATVETRRRMAEVSVDNLMAGLRGEPLPHPVTR
ncbi:MAG: 2-hydroxyacid dehydrogenase [Isosphaeraceae bacterium]